MDFDYLTRRMSEEQQRAASADSKIARDAHQELADHYALLIERLRIADGGPGPQAATAKSTACPGPQRRRPLQSAGIGSIGAAATSRSRRSRR